MSQVLSQNRDVKSVHSSRGVRNANRDLRWFIGASSPDLAAMAEGVELKGSRGSARALAAKTLSSAGLGAVGGEAFITLSRSGVGRLQGFDMDRYEQESWLTQPTTAADAGRLKAEVQGAQAAAVGAGEVLTAAAFVQDVPWWVLRRSDALLVAGDNLEILIAVGNLARRFGIPLLQGAVEGHMWTAFVRVYNMLSPADPCPACAFGRADWLRMQSRHGCDPGAMRAQGTESTRTLPNVCRAAADLLSSEALKTLLDIDGRLVNEELSYCLLSHRTMRTSFTRNPDCRCPHEIPDVIDIDDSLAETTPQKLAVELGMRRDSENWQIRGELPWISFTFCDGCGQQVPIRQFGRPGMDVRRCACGETLTATPVGMRSVIPEEDLEQVAEVSLHDLGLPIGAAVGIEATSGDGPTTWAFVGEPPELAAEAFQQVAAQNAAQE